MPQDVPVFAAPYAPPDEALAQDLLATKPSAEVAAATQDSRAKTSRFDAGEARRDRRRRGFPARIRALLARGARRHGAGGIAAARAGRRDARPAARRPSQGGRFRASSQRLRLAAGAGLRLRARTLGARDRGGRVAARHRRRSRAPPRRSVAARRGEASDAADGRAFRLWRDDSIGAGARQERRRPPFLRHAGRSGAQRATTPSAISTPMPARSKPLARRRANAKRSSGDFRKALGAASALRSDLARSRARRTHAAPARTRASRQGA